MVGVWVHIPAMPAADWLEILLKDPEELDLFNLFEDLLSDDDANHVDQMLLQGKLTLQELQDLTLQVVTQVSGRDWWAAIRLTQIARMQWQFFNGTMLKQGVAPWEISLAAWLDAFWVTLFSEAVKPEKWAEVSMFVEAPVLTDGQDHMETMEMSVDAFSSLMRG